MDLVSLAQLGRIEKEVQIGTFSIKLHTLSTAEQQKAMLSIPEQLKDEAIRSLQLQIAILSLATEHINNQKLDQKSLYDLFSGLQPQVLSTIFDEYLLMIQEQEKVLGELKKN